MKKLFCFVFLACALLWGCEQSGANETTVSENTVPETTAETEFQVEYPTVPATEFQVEYPTVPPTEPEDPEAILAFRRDVVEAAMREQSAILWRPAEDIVYSMWNNSSGVVIDEQTHPEEIVHLYADRIYQGIPYAHGSGSYYSWLSFATEQDENGVYTLTGITDQHLNGKSAYRENVRARLGNDCADQLFWAWGRISGSIQFRSTAGMTEFNGCLKVGDYEYTGTSFSSENNTKDIVAQNGEQRMFAAYAQLQKGDGMVLITRSGAGHAVMVVTSNPVYKADGTIDGEKSFVTVLEQTSGNEPNETYYYNEELGQNVYLCEVMDKEWTYNTILQKGYLPMTIQELVDPSPRPEPVVKESVQITTGDSMFGGVIEANYRISSVTVTISQNGKTVQKATCFGHQEEMYTMNLYRFTKDSEAPVLQGSINLEELPAGTYTCTFTARLSTGDNIEFRNFTFTK